MSPSSAKVWYRWVNIATQWIWINSDHTCSLRVISENHWNILLSEFTNHKTICSLRMPIPTLQLFHLVCGRHDVKFTQYAASSSHIWVYSLWYRTHAVTQGPLSWFRPEYMLSNDWQIPHRNHASRTVTLSRYDATRSLGCDVQTSLLLSFEKENDFLTVRLPHIPKGPNISTDYPTQHGLAMEPRAAEYSHRYRNSIR